MNNFGIIISSGERFTIMREPGSRIVSLYWGNITSVVLNVLVILEITEEPSS